MDPDPLDMRLVNMQSYDKRRISGKCDTVDITGESRVIRMRKHSKGEISQLLAQANELAVQGKLQTDIAQTLGVSVMTLHRWRKASVASPPVVPEEISQTEQDSRNRRIEEVQLENSRLRHLVTDLLLEKMRLEEILQNQQSTNSGSVRAIR